jgi:nanoRNase/pAp phosphatase (c-di-AMP/oligoRNAs hydrolase)
MLTPQKQVPREVTETLRQATSVLLASHVYPDADAIGSQLALGDILASLGKKIFYCPVLNSSGVIFRKHPVLMWQ